MSLLQILRFFLSSPLWHTQQSRILRSAPSSHDRSGTGGAREQSRTCAFRERKQDSTVFPVPSPPRHPSAQRRLLLQHGVIRPGASGKFLKARGHGHDRNGVQPVQPGGNRTQREAGGPPRMRGARCWSTDSGSPAQQSIGLGSQRCTCRSSRESGGETEGREVQGQDSGCWCGHWTVAGTRVHVDTGRDSRACKYQFQVQHPQPPPATRIFPAGGFPGRNGTGSQVFLERGRNCCLHSHGKHFQQQPPPCMAVGSPNGRSSRSLGARWLL